MQKNIVILLLTLFLFFSCELMEEIFFDSDDSSSDTPRLYDDGIPDEYEVPGVEYMGMPLYEWGARPGVADIFIHVATMNYSGTDGGLLLQKAALDKVVAAFADQNIAIHFDVGTTGLYDGITPVDSGEYNLEGLNNQVPYAADIFLDDRYGNTATVEDYHTNYVPNERDNIFYFLVIGSSQNLDGSSGSSGVSWCPGREFLITLANWNLPADNSSYKNRIVNYQAATIMHEFGHNLGLKHGGNENQNYKPNYYSIMNYLYQITGLPVIGNNEGDRYYFNQFYNIGGIWATNYSLYSTYASLVNSPDTSAFKIDYSHGHGGDLYESNLKESSGLRQSGSRGVDWNGDGDRTDSSISYNVNYVDDYDQGISTLKDYNDWDNLFLYYYEYYKGVGRSQTEIEQIRTLEVNEKPRFIPLTK